MSETAPVYVPGEGAPDAGQAAPGRIPLSETINSFQFSIKEMIYSNVYRNCIGFDKCEMVQCVS